MFGKINYFFLWLSVTDPDIIKMGGVLKRDRIIQSIKGQIIFVVSLFATVSGTNAAYIISQSIVPSVLIGVMWGYFILCVDRLLSAPFKRSSYAQSEEKFIHNFLKPILIRLPLALLLGILISIPILLKIFDPEIEDRWIEKKTMDYKADEDTSYSKLISDLEGNDRNINGIRADIENLNILFKGEKIITVPVPDTFSGRVNFSRTEPILAKKALLQQEMLLKQYDTLTKTGNDLLRQKNNFKKKSKKEIAEIVKPGYSSVSLGERYEELKNVINEKEHRNLWWIHFWLQTVIILIELMPVLMKVFSDLSTYDLFVEENFYNTIESIRRKVK
jgi:hypothetical protein